MRVQLLFVVSLVSAIMAAPAPVPLNRTPTWRREDEIVGREPEAAPEPGAPTWRRAGPGERDWRREPVAVAEPSPPPSWR